ncbi:MAG: ATP phosphoribosyltransferase regulatory subunit [Selenomonas massiliensis]
MKSEKLILETPYGTRDLLPEDAAEMRHMENNLSGLFRLWGYDEVVTPTIEHLETLAPRIAEENSLFMLLGNQNKPLALRNEMTTPIARLVSSRLKDAPTPLKLSYLGNVFRVEQTQMGRQCEFHQAGVELMGSDTPASDAEIVALAIESVLTCGIKDFQIHMGQVDFLDGMLAYYEIEDEQCKAFKSAIERHDIVFMNQLIDALPLSLEDRETLKTLPLLNGKDDLLKRLYDLPLNTQSRSAVDNLAAIYALIQSYGYEDYVRFDLGTIRDFNYYTGMVFEGYSIGLGFPLCGGGRYDHLLTEYGHPMPATGFALGVERILLALSRQGVQIRPSSKDVYIGYADACIDKAIRRATELRRAGKVVELGMKGQSRACAEQSCAARGYELLEYFG